MFTFRATLGIMLLIFSKDGDPIAQIVLGLT